MDRTDISHILRSSFGCLCRCGLPDTVPVVVDLSDEAKTAGLVPLGGPLILRRSVIASQLGMRRSSESEGKGNKQLIKEEIANAPWQKSRQAAFQRLPQSRNGNLRFQNMFALFVSVCWWIPLFSHY
jgi:hypothetical protein